MIQINTLKSLDTVNDYYYVNDKFEVINIKTGRVKKVTINKGGYPYVTLDCHRWSGRCNVKVPMHKIVALAFIENKDKYDVIHHIDDNKLNYHPSNLEFTTFLQNIEYAKQSKRYNQNRVERTFEIILKGDDTVYSGTLKELSERLKISKGTLYDTYYNNRDSRKISSIKCISQ